jgi:hypothetical protein
MSRHAIKRLWQKHVLAENRRSIEGLLATLCAEPVYEVMATGEQFAGREGVARFYRIRPLNTPPLAAGMKAGMFPLPWEGKLKKGWGRMPRTDW